VAAVVEIRDPGDAERIGDRFDGVVDRELCVADGDGVARLAEAEDDDAGVLRDRGAGEDTR
jgi:hypothetical protein